jgi:hypothetical protein
MMGCLENDDLKAGIDWDELLLSHVPTSVFPGDEIWYPADERKKERKKPVSRKALFFGGGGKMAQSPQIMRTQILKSPYVNFLVEVGLRPQNAI